MFELKSINVRNFRCHDEFSFVPLPHGQGITALSGPNGAGKSSLLHAFVWALFGKTPNGISTFELQGGPGDVEVGVTFHYQGQQIDVVRRMRGNGDSGSATILVDGTVVLDASCRAANEWIRDLLNMDSESFTTAFIIQQKEVESLMTAGRAERRQVIERLAGVERLSVAIAAAHSDLRAHERVLSASSPTVHIDDLHAQIGRLEASIRQTQMEMAEHAAKQAELRERQMELTDSIGVWSAKAHTYEQLIQRRNSTTAEIASQEALLNELPEPVNTADIEMLHSRHVVLSNELQALEAEYHAQLLSEEKLSMLRERVETSRYEYDRSVLRADELDTHMREIQDQIAAMQTLTTTLDVNRAAIEVMNDDLLRIDARIADVHATVGNLTDASSCPTCEHPIDDRDKLVSRWRRTLMELQDQRSRLREVLDARLQEMELIQQRETQSKELYQQYAALSVRIKEHSQVVEGLAEQLVAARERLSEHETQMAEAGTVQLTDIDRARTNAQEVSLEILSATKSRNAIARREQIQQSIALARRNLLRIEAALTDINIDEVHRILDESQSNKSIADEELSASLAHSAVLSERVDQLMTQKDLVQESLERANREVSTYQAAFSATEELRHTALSLEEFRANRIRRLAPDISAIASTLLRDITGGALIGITFDDDFAANITTGDGEVRSYEQLSGGEAESTSLAVRLAISSVVAGTNEGLLFMDEALTSHDEARRTNALRVVRSLGRQTILINHTVDDIDLVDELITLPGRYVGGGVS